MRPYLTFLFSLLPFLLLGQIRSYETLESFELDRSTVYDLAWDGEHLWSGHKDGKIQRIRTSDGERTRTIDTDHGTLRGLTYDGEKLWAAELESGQLHRIDRESGRTLLSRASPAEGKSRPNGLAYAEGELWAATNDGEDARIHRISLELEKEAEKEVPSVAVHPNPADRYIELRPDDEELPSGKKTIELYAPNGEQVLREHFDEGEQRVQLPELPNGVYLLRLLHDGKDWSQHSLVIEDR